MSAIGDDSLPRALAATLSKLWSDPRVRIGTMEPFGDGHSGLTFLIDLDSERFHGKYVVRISPTGSRIAGPADVGRQGRIMAALAALRFPVPHVLAADSTGLLNGRAIAVLELVHGTDWRKAAAARSDRFIAELAVGALHQLRSVAIERTSLIDEGSFTVEHDLRRWTALLPRCTESLRRPALLLYTALVASVPDPVSPALVHGDFHYGNMLFRDDMLVAVLDWEIAALGDPRADLGCLAVASLRRRYHPDPNPTGDVAVSLSDLASMYGLPKDEMAWFVAAACLKYAAILGYNHDLHVRGKRIDPIYDDLTVTMNHLLTDGATVLRHGIDYP
jgi:aminoglycoside phosphotransferase (APT) family kinase protein